jgi:DNA (cytosine-5)-methyltransferase 1
MTAYYNEIDPYAAQWLRNLIDGGHIAPGDVDTRSIVDVRANDLRGYVQCHFFAGIGGWSYALRLAGWGDDRPVWTGSCPCQPFSSAARGRCRGLADDRHLWPRWRDLIASIKPRVVFGEQVASSYEWQAQSSHDLEDLGYEVGAAIIPACALGFDHARPRYYFVGHADRDCEPSLRLNGEVARLRRHRSDVGIVVPADGLPSGMAVFSAFGNAIVPQVAAEFIIAASEAAE